MEWTNEKTSELIELYRSKPVLWDPSDLGYKNKQKRHDALHELSEILGVQREEVDRKIKNVLGQFRREMKKIKEKKTGTAADGSFESKWFAFKALLFLKDRNKPRPSLSTANDDWDESELNDDTIVDTENDEFVESNEEESGLSQTTAESQKKASSKNDFLLHGKLYRPKKGKSDDPMVEDAYKIMKTVYEGKRGRDECTLFGEQVACKLRKLPSERTRSNVQHIINTVLWEAEFGKYDHYVAMSSSPLRFPGQIYPTSHFSPSSRAPRMPISNFHPYDLSANTEPNKRSERTYESLIGNTSFSENLPSYTNYPSPSLSPHPNPPSFASAFVYGPECEKENYPQHFDNLTAYHEM